MMQGELRAQRALVAELQQRLSGSAEVDASESQGQQVPAPSLMSTANSLVPSTTASGQSDGNSGTG